MKTMRNFLVSLLLLALFAVPATSFAQDENEDQTAENIEDASAVKKAVEDFLLALGNGELEKVRTMFLPYANIASVSRTTGKIFTMSAEQYISDREAKEGRKFKEPVREYSVNISQGALAFVRADATVFYDDLPCHHKTR